MIGRGATLLVLLSLTACFVVVVDANGNEQNPFLGDGGSDGGVMAVANCQVNPTSAGTGQAINFDGSMSMPSPSGSAILTWSWDFGDGSAPAMGEQVSYAYGSSGTYTTVLTVTDSAGVSGATNCDPVTVGP